MFSWYRKILKIGIDDSLPKTAQKRVRLLNLFWSQWVIIQFVLITEDAITKKNPWASILTHLVTLTGVLFIFYFQKTKKFIIARILFFTLLLYSNIMFTNFIEPGKHIEYFYIIIPPFLLLFTNSSKLLYSTFIICYLLFVVPNLFFNIYPEGSRSSSILILVLFVVIFLLVDYFKKANIKNEAILEEQRNKLLDLNERQSQFFINVSHEIRTPLTLIKGQTNKLKTYSDDKRIQNIESQLNYQTDKIRKIVDDVIDLAKMKTSSFTLLKTTTSVADLIAKIVFTFEPLFKQKEIDFKFINSSINNTAHIDVSFFERAVNNIIVNALKYTDRKGKVHLKLFEDNNNILLQIKDNGIGIAKEDVDKIYNRFYQVNNDINKAGGSGVGLAFSKEIVKRHAGTLSLKSTLGEGSSFMIALPKIEHQILATETEALKEIYFQEETETNSTNTTLFNILIVDDSFEMRNYLKELLSDYNCYEAENGIDALQVVKKQKIDCVVTDYMMPKMNGLNLIKNLNKIRFQNPILVLTARTDYQSKLEVLRLGIDGFINKPFEKEELQIIIKNRLSNNLKRKKYISKEKIPSDVTESESKKWLLKVKNYIDENCGKITLDQEDIAAKFYLSKSSFYRKIKTETGLTPNEFIKEIKLEKAKSLIEQKRAHSLKQLTLDVGFTHSSYFSKMYYKRFGIQPSKELKRYSTISHLK